MVKKKRRNSMSRLSRWYVYIEVCYVHIPCFYSAAYVYLESGKQVGFRSSDLSSVKVAQMQVFFFLTHVYFTYAYSLNILRFSL